MTLLIVQALIGMRAEIVQGRVATSAIVECFHIKEKVVSGLVAIVLPLVLYAFFAHIAGVAVPQGEFIRLP